MFYVHFCVFLLCPHFLRRGAYRFCSCPFCLCPYVRMSLRPSRKVCITHNSETVCTIEFNTYRLMALDIVKICYFQFVSPITLDHLFHRLETSQICCSGYEDVHLYIFIQLNLILTVMSVCLYVHPEKFVSRVTVKRFVL